MKKHNHFIMCKNFLVYLITIFSIESIFIYLNGFTFFEWSTFRILLSTIIISLILSFIGSFLKLKYQKILTFIVLLVFTIYTFAQFAFVNYMGVYASVNASSQIGAVTDYFSEFIHSFKPNYYLILLPIITYIIISIMTTSKRTIKLAPSSKRKLTTIAFRKTIVTALLLGVVFNLYNITMTSDKFKSTTQTVSLNDLFNNASLPTLSVKNFGVLGYAISDIKYMVTGGSNVINLYGSGNIAAPKEVDRYFDDTKWEELLNQETDENYKIIHSYLMNRQSSSINDYTGMFEGKNVIFVMMESVNDIILTPEYFPNFATLMDNGHYYENNYSPRNSCPTGNNEFSGITSLYSIYNTCTTNDYRYNEYPESIFNLLKDIDYNVISMHNYTEHYYYRKTIHPNLGAYKYYGVDDINIPYDSYNYKNWSSDIDFAASAMDILINEYGTDDNFAMWLTTVTAHQPYTLDSNESIVYADYFTELGFTDEMNRYLSKLKHTDDLFGIILERLEEEGILDDTVIVVYGDHYPYGLGDELIEEYTGRDLSIDYEKDIVPFIIYNPGLEAEIKNEYTTFMNITPTVANLLNLDYDPRLYFGLDLYSKEFESRAVYSDGSWKNEIAYFNAQTSEIIYFGDVTYTEDELMEINAQITNDMTVSTSIIKNNYFNYLYNALDNIYVESEEEKEEEENEISNSGIPS